LESAFANKLTCSSRLVRHSVSSLVAAIAKVEMTLGGWKELFQFLGQCSTNENPNLREVLK
jgi:hypothetical protein